MSTQVFRRLVATATLALLGQFAAAPAAKAQVITVRPQARILQQVDGRVTSSFPNSTPRAIAKATDLGAVAPNTPMHVALVLKSSDAQEHALRTLIDEQHDKGTANFHKWVTPEQFGASFGVADADIQKINNWLQSQGFSIDTVAKGRRLITFSGTSGQVEAAFHTSMRKYSVSGEAHISNSTDISVPAALKEVIASAPKLSDFESKPMHTAYREVTRGNDGKYVESVDGNFNYSGGGNYMAPGDFAKIYNTTTSGMDGSGVTIGIVGRTNILLADVQAYRRLFGLPDNDPTIAPVGVLPGHSTGDEVESDLDVEWAGGVAPKAKIIFAPAASTLGVRGKNQVAGYFDGVSISALALVEANQADIISVSYGSCEARSGGPGYWDILWEQAAAQGQSVFVSSGDSGAAGCDAAGSSTEQFGFGVNVIASSNFNTAVGGTQFNEGTGTYWGQTNSPTSVSALGYIPETSWNEGSSVTGNPRSGLFASGGGVSTFFSRPSWQIGSGVPAIDPIDVSQQGIGLAGPHRLLPDVSLTAAGHDGAIVCYEGACSINTDGSLRGFGAVGGTSLAAPSFAGLQALINQKMGGRQGLANYQYYALANSQYKTVACDAAGASAPDAKCIFNDTTTGNNGEINFDSGNVDTGFNAGPGYDLVTGLGSVNATNLINNFGSVAFKSTTTTLALNKTTFTRDQAVDLTINVAAGSGNGTPTGDVTIVTTLTDGNPVPAFFTLTNGTATGTLSGLAGGTYKVFARYGGDGIFGASTSAPVTVAVGAEASVTTSDLFAFVGGQKASYDGGDAIAIDAFVSTNSGSNNNGVTTGTVSFIDNGATVATLPLNAYGTVQLIAGHNYTNYPTNAPAFAIGNHSVVAHFNGNAGMNASSAAPLTFTVTKGATVVNLIGSVNNIASAGSVTFNVSIPNVGSVAATGTVTFLDGTTAIGTQTLTNGSAALVTTAITTAGPHSITASYAGDANYTAGVSLPAVVTVGVTTPTSLTLTAANSAPAVNQVNNYTATLSVNVSNPAVAKPNNIFIFFPTGSIRLYDGTALLGTVPVSGPTATIPVAGLSVGAHNITAVYTGDSNFASSASAATVVTPVPNTTGLRLMNKGTSTYGGQVSFQARVFANPSMIPITPSQQVQFFDGTTLLGTAPLVFFGDTGYYLATFNSNALGGGTHSITAVYSGDPNYTTATGLGPLSLVVAQLPSTTALTLSSTTAIQTQTVTLTANVATAVTGPAPATGTVQFLDGTTVLGTSPVNAAGAATLSTSFLTTGAHSLTATYSGDANYSGSSSTASTATTQTVTPAFTLNSNPSSLTVKRGENGILAITLSPAAGFSGTVTLGCTNLPTNAACNFTPQTVFLGSGSGPQTIELILNGHTTGTAQAAMTPTDGGTQSPIPALAFWLPGAALSGFGLGRKRSARQRQMLLLAIFALGLGGMIGLAGCGTGNGVSAAPGTYNVQVTGTSGSVTNAVPVAITVK